MFEDEIEIYFILKEILVPDLPHSYITKNKSKVYKISKYKNIKCHM